MLGKVEVRKTVIRIQYVGGEPICSKRKKSVIHFYQVCVMDCIVFTEVVNASCLLNLVWHNLIADPLKTTVG